jgi:hypothetical protein
MTLRRLLFILPALLISTSAFAGHNHHQHNNESVNQDKVQFSYVYSRGTMDNLNKSENDYFSDTTHMMKPESMEMEMHMLGAHYYLNKNWSLMVMSSYQIKQMKMITRMGRRKVKSSSQGVGDTTLSLNYDLQLKNKSQFVFTGGASIPTGSIQKKDNSVQLPYGMQMGTGSYGLIAGVSFQKSLGRFNFYTAGEFTSYLNENSESYTFGLQSKFDGQVSYAVNHYFSFLVGFHNKISDPLSSEEDTISNMSSAYSPSNQHGSRSHYSLGIETIHNGVRGALSYFKPLNDDLAGIQIDSGDRISLELSFLL